MSLIPGVVSDPPFCIERGSVDFTAAVLPAVLDGLGITFRLWGTFALACRAIASHGLLDY